MTEEVYVNKKQLKNQGFSKNEKGIYYKKTILEKYYDLGYLSLFEEKFGAADRLLAGQRIAFDYYMANRCSLQSVKQFVTNIRTTGDSGRESQLYYKERYFRAIRVIPKEFWPTVRFVCIEDNEITDNKNPKGSLGYKHNVYCMKVFLCLGLDRLSEFYSQKK